MHTQENHMAEHRQAHLAFILKEKSTKGIILFLSLADKRFL